MKWQLEFLFVFALRDFQTEVNEESWLNVFVIIQTYIFNLVYVCACVCAEFTES